METRIALCLSGQLRSWKEGYEYHKKNLLDQYEPGEIDIFLHTWEHPSGDDLSVAHRYGVIDWWVDKEFPREQFDKYSVVDNKWPAFNTFSMWYSVFKANELKREYELKNGFRYDVVIRSRFDFALNRVLDLDTMEKGKLYVPNDLIKGHIPPNQKHANDQFAYGDSNVMDLYSMTFWNIDRAYNMGVPVNGEDVLSANLQLTGLAGNLVYIDMHHPFPPGKYNSTPHSLIRDDFTGWNKLRG